MTAVVIWESDRAVSCADRDEARGVVATLLTQARSDGIHCSSPARDEWMVDDGEFAGRITIEREFDTFDEFDRFELVEPDDLN